MPDWFYRTVSRPLLFRISAPRARDLALGFMGRLAKLPLGGFVIDFLGHMRPDERLRGSVLGLEFSSPVGLGPALDSHAVALPALARFGFGFLEVGPVSMEEACGTEGIERDPEREALWLADPPTMVPIEPAAVGRFEKRSYVARIAAASRLGMPLLVRLGSKPGVAAEALAQEHHRIASDVLSLAADRGHVLFSTTALTVALQDGWTTEAWRRYVETVSASSRLLACITADADWIVARPFVDASAAAGVAGFLVDGSVAAERGGRWLGLPARAPALELVGQMRRHLGSEGVLVVSGGIHEPADALAFLAAGASLLQIDTGLIYSGPGLAKRVNEAILFARTEEGCRAECVRERSVEMTWFWTLLLGGGMLFGSLLALVIAATRVVLHYDEDFVGLSRAQLNQVNPRLLPFMAHDRVSLAGTMIAVGVMYVGLSAFGVRRGLGWARQAIFYSAFTGFASFFLFLGFGYLDPFHAFVTATLFQVLLMAVHARLGTHTPETPPPLRGDWAWRVGLWGQFLLILHGVGLLTAGLAISTIGVTQVFVHEDLDFLRTTTAALDAVNPRLVPLIAHDRATFGGMLLSSGWVFLLPALWGFRAGDRWLWWTMLIAGLSAYIPAIGIHYAVGYTNWFHLVPAFLGCALFLHGLVLAYPFLARPARRST